MEPLVEVTVVPPQSSVALAEPSAPSMSAVDGLQPSANALPIAVIVGPVRLAVQVAVLEVVDVFPHASVAVNVLVCDRIHASLRMGPVVVVTVAVPHPSVAVALPNAAFMAADVGLHPKMPLAGVPVAVIAGAVTSTVHVAVLDVFDVLPQISIAVHVLVCNLAHPFDCTEPSAEVNVGAAQLSVAVALPSAASIAAVEGLQPTARALPVAVIVGEVLSFNQVKVRDVVAVFPQASVAVKVLVWE
jgi:hypothetical protein